MYPRERTANGLNGLFENGKQRLPVLRVITIGAGKQSHDSPQLITVFRKGRVSI